MEPLKATRPASKGGQKTPDWCEFPLWIGLFGALFWSAGCGRSPQPGKPAGAGPATATFNRDVAPILFAHCSPCHRPGQSGPFPLLNYADAAKHATDIVDVTARRFMPPWLPADEPGKLVGDRRLTSEQVAVFERWVAGGKQEGSASYLPPTPAWSSEWILGKPDLVAEMPEAYVLPADGKDVYRHVVVPVKLDRPRYVEAVEFRPNSPAVHHAFVYIDRSGEARRQDAQDPEPGIPGMDTPHYLQSPGGQFTSWQPGKVPVRASPGLGWRIEPGTDIVLQLHLQPRGKPEPVRPSIAFYFTDQAPTNRARKLVLTTYALDIPAGSRDVVVSDECVLPSDCDLIAVLPHTHYLGKRVFGSATLPSGVTQTLLHIPSWDFRWQGEYTYAKPMFLPKGTRLRMEFGFDNSSANPLNPNNPPIRVGYGSNSTDEMAEFWLQLLPRTGIDALGLDRELLDRTAKDTVELNELRLKRDPRNARAHVNLGRVCLMKKDWKQAWDHFNKAADIDPRLDDAQYYRGLVLRVQGRQEEAVAAFQRTVELNPNNARAHGNLGLIELGAGRIESAAGHFARAVELDPSDGLARENLGLIRWGQGRRAEAEELLARAAELNPTDQELAAKLKLLRAGGALPAGGR